MDERAETSPAEVFQEFFQDENLRTVVALFIDDVSQVSGMGKLVVRRYNEATIRFYAVWDVEGGDRAKVTNLCSESFSAYAKHNTDFLVIHYLQEEFIQREENNQHFKSTSSGTIWERSKEAK